MPPRRLLLALSLIAIAVATRAQANETLVADAPGHVTPAVIPLVDLPALLAYAPRGIPRSLRVVLIGKTAACSMPPGLQARLAPLAAARAGSGPATRHLPT